MLSASLLSPLDIVPELTPVGALLLGLLPLIGSFVAEFVMGGLKTYLNFVDRQSAFVKKMISAVIGLVIGAGLGAIGQAATNPDVSTWTPEIITGILTALGQAGVFRMFKRQAAAASGGTADASAVVNK